MEAPSRYMIARVFVLPSGLRILGVSTRRARGKARKSQLHCFPSGMAHAVYLVGILDLVVVVVKVP